MTVSNLRVKVLRQPIIRSRFIPWLPATIVGRTGISVERDGLTYLLDLDYSKFFEINAFTPADKLIAVQGRDGIWNTTSIETLRHQIGADNPNLVAISGAATATDKLGWWSDPAQYSLTDFTSYMRSLLDDPDASTARATLGLVIGTDVQPHDAELDALAGLVSAADKLPYFTGPGAAALTGLTSYARSLLDDADAATARATLGLVIGTDVQAHDSDLDAIAALTPADNDFIQRKAGAWVNRSIAQVKTDLAISNVDNTSDLNKPISTATQGALDLKADKTTTLSAGTGLTGGGDLSANRSIALDSASVASLGKADTAVQPARAVNTGTGLTGGGDLSGDRTIALDTASQTSLAKADTAVQPADLGALAVKSQIGVPGDINATGTPSSSTYLRGDGVWAAGGGGGGGDLLAANNLSDLDNAATSRSNLGATAVGDALFTAANAAAARDVVHVREALNADRTYYVRTDGSDANTGLDNSAGSAFKTVAKALDVVSALDVGPYQVTISLGAGSFGEDIFLPCVFAKKPPVLVGASMSSTTLRSVGADGSLQGATWYLKDFGFVGDASISLYMRGPGKIKIENIAFGGSAGKSQHCRVEGGAYLDIRSMSISVGTTGWSFDCLGGSNIDAHSATIDFTANVSGAPLFSARGPGYLQIWLTTFNLNGFTVTGSRYEASANGVIEAGGAGGSYIPGSSPGTVTTGGQYI